MKKSLLSKLMIMQSNVLILDEPTRGIDVGAKFEIYTIMNQLVEQGMSIIMISSELAEIQRCSDRVIVMCEGRITADIPIEEASQENIMKYAMMRGDS